MTNLLKSKKGRIIAIATAVLLIAAIILTFVLTMGREIGYRSISVSMIVGKVTIENNGNEYEAYANMRLADGYAMTTGVESYAHLNLDEDKYVKLEQESRAVFTKVGNANSHVTAINLESGSLKAELVNPLSDEESFVVTTPNAVLAVRGTFFRIAVTKEASGEAFTNVYTYGGTVACQRIMPDGNVVNEELMINEGYKTCVKMDDTTTVYVEQAIGDEYVGSVVPIDINEISDEDMIDIYNASSHGHSMFLKTEELWQEVNNREINIAEYYSVYDFGEVKPYIGKESTSDSQTSEPEATYDTGTESGTSDTSVSETTDATTTETTTAADSITVPIPVIPTPVIPAITGSTTVTPPEITSTTAETTVSSTTAETTTEMTSTTVETTTESSTTAETTTELTSTTAETTTESSTAAETTAEITSTTAETNTTSSAIVTTPAITSTTEATTTITVPAVTTTPEVTTTVSSTVTTTPEVTTTTVTTPVTTTTEATTTEPEVTTSETTTESSTTVTVPEVATTPEETTSESTTEVTPDVTEPTPEDTTSESTTEVTPDVTESTPEETTSESTTEVTPEVTEPTPEETTSETTTEVTPDPPESTPEESSSTEESTEPEPEPVEPDGVIYIDDGSIIISATGYKQGVYEELAGVEEISYTGAYVIMQRDSSAVLDHYIGIYADVPITLDGINIHAIELYSNSITLSGSDKENHVSQIINGNAQSYQPALSLKEIKLNVCESTVEADVKISVDTLTLDSGELYVGTSLQGYAIIADEINVNGGVFEMEYSGTGYPMDYSAMNITGGRVFAAENGAARPWLSESAQRPAINVSGGFLWVNGTEFANIAVTGGCIAVGDDYSTDNWSNGTTEYACIVYDADECPGNITVNLMDGTAYTYTVDTEDAAENGKYYVWLPADRDTRIKIDEINFPDPVFREYILNGTFVTFDDEEVYFDTDRDGYLSEEECAAVQMIELKSGEKSIEGIEYFTELYWISCAEEVDCSELEYIDVSRNTKLNTFYCSGTGITTLDLSKNTELMMLVCSNTGLTSLDLSNNTNLVYLICDNTKITSLDLSNNLELTTVYCYDNPQLTTIDLGNNTELGKLTCSGTGITALDLSKNINIRQLDCSDTKITQLDVSKNTALEELDCSNTNLTELDVSENTALEELYLNNTKITRINLSKNTELRHLECANSGISELDLSANNTLYYLDCSNTKITVLDLSGNRLSTLYCNNCNLAYVNIWKDNSFKLNPTYFNASGNEYSIPSNSVTFNSSKIPGFDPARVSDVEGADFDPETGIFSNITGDTITYNYNCDGKHCDGPACAENGCDENGCSAYCCNGSSCSGSGLIVKFTLTLNGEEAEELAINEANFPDEVFREFVKTNYDKNSNGSLSDAEIDAVVEMAVPSGTKSIKGIEYFTELMELYCVETEMTSLDVSKNINLLALLCYDSAGITAVDVSKNTKLRYLDCSGTGVTGLDLSKNTELISLNCSNTAISVLDLSNNSKLTDLDCSGTEISELVLSGNTELETLECYDTNIIVLDVSSNNVLSNLDCHNTKITRLVVSGNTELTDLRCNSTGISELDVSNNLALRCLDCSDTEITTLNLNSNTALTYLDCSGTKISALNLSNNTALTDLDCSGTEISALNLNNNTALTHLECSDTGITSLDVSNNGELTDLDCSNTKITALDVSKNDKLSTLKCDNCSLAYVDVSGNSLLSDFSASGNKYSIPSNATVFSTFTISGFNKINVDQSSVKGADFDPSTGVFSNISGDVTYAYNCGYGEPVTFTLTLTGEPIDGIAISAANFPDAAFRAYVLAHADNDGNGFLSNEECEAVTEIDVSGSSDNGYVDGGVTSLEGMGYFTKLTTLDCSFNHELTQLDISANTALTSLTCEGIALPEDTEFEGLELDLSENTNLTELRCSGSGVISLDLSKFTYLEVLYCDDTKITALNLEKTLNITHLDCSGTELTQLDVSKNTMLEYLNCSDTRITVLDLSTLRVLNTLKCDNCRLAYIDVSKNFDGYLSDFSASGNKHSIPSNVVNFNASDITGFDPAKVSNVKGADFNSTTGVFSNFADGMTAITYTYDCGRGFSAEFALMPDGDPASISDLFPDAAFSAYVSENFDEDSDGYLSEEECAKVTEIDVSQESYNYWSPENVKSLKGIEYFPDLLTLKCSNNKDLPSIDLSRNTALTHLECASTGITVLDVSKHTALTHLDCNDTKIESLDLTNLTELTYLDCSSSDYYDHGNISDLNLVKNTKLTHLYCDNNMNLTVLDVKANTELIELRCDNTQITELDLSENKELAVLYCGFSEITELDLSNNTNLTYLDCQYAQKLTSLNISKCTVLDYLLCGYTALPYLDLSNCKKLTYLGCRGSCLAYVDIEETLISDESSFGAFENVYRIPLSSDEFDTKTIPGFDPSKVSNVSSTADWHDDTGIFSNITGDVTYTYDCGHNLKETFTLSPILAVSEDTFPNEFFRNYVLTNFDQNYDGFLTKEECNAVTSIDVSYKAEVTSLEGIEYFPNLTLLRCFYCSELKSLDVSRNTKLKQLECNDTAISYLDLSQNPELTFLMCGYCRLAYIDVTNKKLTTFSADSNKYPIPSNSLIFNTHSIPGFDPSKVSNVSDTASWDPATGIFSEIKGNISYTYDCGSGNSKVFTLTLTGDPIEEVRINEATFPDPGFREYVLENIDLDGDERLSVEELAVDSIFIQGMPIIDEDNPPASEDEIEYTDPGVASFKGIEYFPYLTTLYCLDNSELTSIDVSKNTNLQSLICRNTGITSLDLSKNNGLIALDCGSTGITELDLSNNPKLREVRCNNCCLAYLDLSENVVLTDNQEAILDAEGNIYPISADAETFDAKTAFKSFDPSKVSEWSGADFDTSTGIFSNFSSDTVTYKYDCGEVRGVQQNITFTLKKTSTNNFAIPGTNSFSVGSLPIAGDSKSNTASISYSATAGPLILERAMPESESMPLEDLSGSNAASTVIACSIRLFLQRATAVQ